MDFADHLKALASNIPNRLDHIKTEEAAKTSFILPFIQLLGYNVFDITEVVPEFDANVGTSKKYKLDYAILQDGKPIILIECKKPGENLDDAYSQLFHYFSATESRIGILTDGIHYRFYADLEKNNKMDERPFLEVDLLNLSDQIIPELKKLTKSNFDLEDAISTATVLKYTRGIKAILKRQLTCPDDEFVRFFFKELCPNKVFTGKSKESFIEFTTRSFEEFIREELENLIDEVRKPKPLTQIAIEEANELDSPIEDEAEVLKVQTTEQELQGYYIVRAILCETIDSNRIQYRDNMSYFNVLLDDSNRKPICRLYFHTSNFKLGLFILSEGGRQEEKIQIERVEDLYRYAQHFKKIVEFYDKG